MGENLLKTLFIILWIAAPPAGSFALGLTQNPTELLVLSVLWIVANSVGAFVYKVWQKLQDPLIDSTAEAIQNTVTGLIRRYRRDYLQHLVYRHRSFDVKGLSTQGIYTLEMAQIFVELSIALQTPHDTTTNPIASLPDALQQGSHPIWQYLQAEGQHLAVIGPPGSGKTTLLKHA